MKGIWESVGSGRWRWLKYMYVYKYEIFKECVCVRVCVNWEDNNVKVLNRKIEKGEKEE